MPVTVQLDGDKVKVNGVDRGQDLVDSLGYSAGLTPGTAAANKAAVLGANKNLDVLAIADLKLGAGAGTSIVPTAAKINLLAQGVAAGYKIARGVATTASASDTIATGLATVIAAIACLEDAPSVATLLVQAVVGDQAGAPAAGSILLKSWKPTAVNDVTPIAATSFGKLVSWVALGT